MRKRSSLNPRDYEEDQKFYHCGIASLMYCLRVYGVVATQKELRKAAGLSALFVWFKGVEPPYIAKAAEHYGFSAVEHTYKTRDEFENAVKKRALQGKPSIVLIYNYGHWIAVLGWDNKFILRDPDDKTTKVFKYQTHIRYSNNNERYDGNSEYCALFIDRKK